MNPYIYESFKKDMLDSVKDFIESTKYRIKYIDDNSIFLTNGVFNLNFYLDGASMVCTINAEQEKEKSFYEVFKENNVEEEYPFDKDNKYSYEEWNKFKVKRILEIFKKDLKKYIE